MRAAYAKHPVMLARYLAVPIEAAPALVFDFTSWGEPFRWDAIVFSVVNNTNADVVGRPGISPDGTNEASVGVGVPEAVTIAAGATSWDQYGVDLCPPWWRYWVSGAGAGTIDVFVFVVPRSNTSVPDL